MGIQIAKPVPNLERLSKLTDTITRLEKFHSSLQVKKEVWVEGLIIYGTGLFFVVGGCLYLFAPADTPAYRKLCIISCALYPVLLVLIKEFVIWVFNLRLDSTAYKLTCLRVERKKVTDAIMKAEPWRTWKGAQARKGEDSGPPRPEAVVPARAGPPVHEPALPPKKGFLDKLLEFIAGEGSSYRFALICSRCCSHNGMALREEYEYISFQCYNCNFFNPARKVRPPPPKLGVEIPGPDEPDEPDEPDMQAIREDVKRRSIDAPNRWRKTQTVVLTRTGRDLR